MKAIILAAGRGERLGGEFGARPKALLTFGGRTLLERHLALLGRVGVRDIVVATGFQAEQIASELERLGALAEGVRCVHNPAFTDGSVVTLYVTREHLVYGGAVLLMDGDVLYDRRMLDRLLRSAHPNCYLLDRNIEPGEEPMKLAVKGGRLIDFARRLDAACDYYGESVGFFRFTAAIAAALPGACRALIDAGRAGENHEAALRALLRDSPAGTFGFEDITGLPWTEIDFPEDVRRANDDILPRLIPLES
ncbi:MAG TPA: phosphocholine cytidylyltransferase family protein [Alphaproteobacteria bacterium]|nr:phosphocholine cytidylyltransferase family protein [Alphaproteobacteria bacterium]